MPRAVCARLSLCAISLFFCLAYTSSQPAIALADLPAILDGMTVDYYKASLTTGLGSFTYAESQLPTPFSRWLEDELRQALTITSRLKLFDKRVAAAMDPVIRQNYMKFFGSEPVDALLYGRYARDGASVKVTFSLTDLSTGQLIAEKRISISSSQIPTGTRIEPFVQTQQTATELAEVGKDAAQSASPLVLTMVPDRGIGATYRDGENLTLLITINKDAYLKLYHVDVNGVAKLIFPNRFKSSGLIFKGEAMRFPAVSDRFVFRMEAPYGTEYIKAIASTVPFATMEPALTDLGGSAAEAITKGLPIDAPGDFERAEALAVYEILP